MVGSSASGEERRGRVARGVAEVRGRIAAAALRAGRAPGDVRLVAVTKTHPVEAVRAAFDAGVEDFGENHAVDLAAKAVSVPATWHFIGKLQSGTVRHVADHADFVQSAEPGGALDRLARRRAGAGRPLPVLIEVDLTAGRQGVAPDAALAFADRVAAMPGLLLRGLMTVPPVTPDAQGARPYFARLRALSERLRTAHPDAAELSMGMSLDYEVGVEEGATMVRVGTAVFGPRPLNR
jgi:pyridoxal phosphate enzyme (YggS family)